MSWNSFIDESGVMGDMNWNLKNVLLSIRYQALTDNNFSVCLILLKHGFLCDQIPKIVNLYTVFYFFAQSHISL